MMWRLSMCTALRLTIVLVLIWKAWWAPVPAGAAPRAASPVTVTLACIGDVMCEAPTLESAYDGAVGTYDFGSILALSTPYLALADYTTGNLETCLAGPAPGYHGTPPFNSPAELARDLRGAGVDLVTTANNHCLDMGLDGLEGTLDTLDAFGLAHAGTYRTPEEKAVPFVRDLRGFRVAILSHAATTNGPPIPAAEDYAVNYISVESVSAEARAARANGADLVLALLHFGHMFDREPSSFERQLAAKLVAGGVDVIVGCHPHVTQPIEAVRVRRGGRPYQGIVAYSLGNFLSNKRERYRDSGIILYLELEKTDQGATVRSLRYLPVWVQQRTVGGRVCVRVLPVHPNIPLASDIGLTRAELDRMQQVWQEMNLQLNSSEPRVAPIDIPPPGLQVPPATLTGGLVTPASGARSVVFSWRVKYWNNNNAPPDGIWVAIRFPTLQKTFWYSMHPCDPGDTKYNDGAAYQYSLRWLPPGAYAYRFAARQGAWLSYWPAPAGTYARGPTVVGP